MLLVLQAIAMHHGQSLTVNMNCHGNRWAKKNCIDGVGRGFKPGEFSIKGKGMFLYGAVSSPSDCSNRFTLYPLTDLLIPTPT